MEEVYKGQYYHMKSLTSFNNSKQHDWIRYDSNMWGSILRDIENGIYCHL